MTKPIALWWRDDDAGEASPALDRLLDIKRRWNVPLSLAVIPDQASVSLQRAASEPDVDILVHGFAHRNHAASGSKKAEFTANRDLEDMRRDWSAGRAKLTAIIPQTLPVFVPPWNRFPHDRLACLTTAGYQGFSAWSDERAWPATPGLTIANAHIDVIDWRGGAVAKSLPAILAELDMLVASGRHSMSAPIGLLTHHKQMPDESFVAVEAFFGLTGQTPAFVWTGARSIFRRLE